MDTPQALIVGKWTLQNASFTSYRNDTLIGTGTYDNCNCSVQFNKNGTFSDLYNVAGSYPSDTTIGNYSINDNTLSLITSSDHGYVSGVLIPTPVAYFAGGQLDKRNLATNLDQITQLTASTLSVHATVTSIPVGSDVYKAVIDETYTR